METNNVSKIKSEVDFQWFSDRFKEGVLFQTNEIRGKSEPMSKESFERFREFIKCVIEIYQNDWDIKIQHFGLVNDKQVFTISSIDLYFPQITISNTQHRSHIIKDLYVRVPIVITERKIKVRKILGTRSSQTYLEWSNGYRHSHLISSPRSISFPNFSDFCLGTGEINALMSEINSEDFSRDRMLQFLINIITVVTHESLEGTPYIRIESLRENNVLGTLRTPSNGDCSEVLMAFLSKGIVPDIEFDLVDNGKIQVIDNEKLNLFLISLPTTENQKKNLLVCKNSLNEYISYGTGSRIEPPTNVLARGEYYFRGLLIPYQITEIPEEIDKNRIVYEPNSYYKEYAKRFINQRVSQTLVLSCTKQRYKV